MKKIILISGLLLFFCAQGHCAQRTYIYKSTNPYNRVIMRPTYNPYSYRPYYNQYNYRRYNQNNPKRIERLNKIRRLNRLRNNFLSWDFNNNNFTNNFSNGKLTGYSMPITNNSANQILNLPNTKTTSPYCNTELFSTPSGYEMYRSNGEYFKDNRELGSKAGVRIIYD